MSGRKSKRRGSSFEIAVAKYLGMKKAHYKRHDLEGHPLITVECKKREKLPKSIKKWFLQAFTACETGKIPVLVISELGKHTGDALTVLRLADFQYLIKHETTLREAKIYFEQQGLE